MMQQQEGEEDVEEDLFGALHQSVQEQILGERASGTGGAGSLAPGLLAPASDAPLNTPTLHIYSLSHTGVLDSRTLGRASATCKGLRSVCKELARTLQVSGVCRAHLQAASNAKVGSVGT